MWWSCRRLPLSLAILKRKTIFWLGEGTKFVAQIIDVAGETHRCQAFIYTRRVNSKEFIAHVRIVYRRLRSKTLRGINTFSRLRTT